MTITPEREKFLPKQMHLFDPETLARAAVESSFVVEECRFFDRSDFPPDLRLDGRESVGLIAVKPGR